MKIEGTNLEILRDLAYMDRREPGRGWRPLDVGGSGHNGYGHRLKRMCDAGFVERNFGLGWGQPKSGHDARGSCRYRITKAGHALIDAERG